ncbi:M56 family metallopeptidase [Modestobacter sp. SSW1-42]|uniref:M56 family metallopeptidase n=1 Tax=Modestobacter sp. SSW1-42 TaxID=596372 RepID=UPI0039875396
MTAALALAVIGVTILLAGPRLAGAAWTTQAPRLAILAWQALTFSAVTAFALAGVTLLIPVTTLAGDLGAVFHACAVSVASAYGSAEFLPGALAGTLLAGVVPAWVLACAAWELCSGWRRRRELHRSIDLVAELDHELGVLVMDAQAPAAFCVPGRKTRIVVTTGTLAALSGDELRGVLAHEAAHLRARHNLAVTLSQALMRAFPRVRLFQVASAQTRQLIELLADDAAAADVDRVSVASAIVSLVEMRAPAAAMAMAQEGAVLRVSRLLQPVAPMAPWRHRLLAGGLWVVLLAPVLIAGLPTLSAALNDLCNI